MSKIIYVLGRLLSLSCLQLETYPGRDKLASDLGLNLSSADGPLISQLLHRPTTASSAGALDSGVNSTTPPVSIASLSTATVPTTATSLIACETTFAPATLSQLDTVTAIPSSCATPDSNRQPFSTHFSNTTTTTISSTTTGTTTAAAAISHSENSDSFSPKSQNDLSHPANSLLDALLSPKRERGGKAVQSGSQKVDDSSVITDYMKADSSNNGPTVGENSKSVDVIGNSRDSGGGVGGSGPPKSRTISLTPQVIKPSTNGEE